MVPLVVGQTPSNAWGLFDMLGDPAFDACVAAINACSRAAVQVTRGDEDLCVWAIEGADGTLRLLARNDRHTRTEGTIELARRI